MQNQKITSHKEEIKAQVKEDIQKPLHSEILSTGTTCHPISSQAKQTMATNPGKSSSTPENNLDEQRIKVLFMRLSAIYGNLWSSRMPTQDAMRIGIAEWRKALKEITSEQIKYALEKCRDPLSKHSDNPPTLGQFIRLCLPSPEDLGILDIEEAYFQALNPNLTRHRLVEKAIQCIGAYSFRMMSEFEARKRFVPVYEQLVEREMREQGRLILLENNTSQTKY